MPKDNMESFEINPSFDVLDEDMQVAIAIGVRGEKGEKGEKGDKGDGDMLKSVYDTNDDGIVDKARYAALAGSADSAGWADQAGNAENDERGRNIIDTYATKDEITAATDYEQLTNQPMIEGNTLIGNKTFEELGLEDITPQIIDDLFDELEYGG